jgi:hypothetical protein
MPANPSASPAKQIAGFIAKFDPANAKLIPECRAVIRRLIPTAVELVCDNSNFFVIGYSATERPSDCLVPLAAAANGVGLSFHYGASLPDPQPGQTFASCAGRRSHHHKVSFHKATPTPQGSKCRLTRGSRVLSFED